MTVKQAWGAFVIGLIVLVVSLFVKTNQLRQEEDMKTLMVPIEVTDTQYLALESISDYDAHQAAQIIANRAVTEAADKEIKAFGNETEFLISEAEEAIAEATASHWESKEAVKELEESVPKYDPMPRTESVFNAEVADVEAAVLLADHLTKQKGVHRGPSGREKWYNLPMEGCVEIMRNLGYDEEKYPYWVREDGVKMFGPYVMVAANTVIRPKGTILDTSLGESIVVDACGEALSETDLLDIAVVW